MLRELAAVDHAVCGNDLEARVTEIRLIHALSPRYNAQGRHWRRYTYVKLTLAERWPRLAVVRTAPADGALYLGPVGSSRAAHLVVEAIESVAGLRRCRGRVPARGRRAGPCTPAQLGVAACPCAGDVDPGEYAALVGRTAAALVDSPAELLAPLRRRIEVLASAQRYEEAAAARDRAVALARVVNRQRRIAALRAAGRLVLRIDGEGGVVLDRGVLVDAWDHWGRRPGAGGRLTGTVLPAVRPAAVDGPAAPVAREDVDELACVARWLDQQAGRIRIEEAEGSLSWPAWPLDELVPGRGPGG